MSSYTIHRSDYHLTVRVDERNISSPRFFMESGPQRRYFWCAAEESGAIKICHGFPETLALPDPEVARDELDQALEDREILEEAVESAKQLHGQRLPLRLTLSIEQNSAAFRDDNGRAETARLLRRLASLIEQNPMDDTSYSLMDMNGVTVGTAEQTTCSGIEEDLA